MSNAAFEVSRPIAAPFVRGMSGRVQLTPYGSFAYNMSAATIGTLQDAIRQQKAGAARAKAGFLGTSIPVGNMTGTGTNGHNGAAPLCYPSQCQSIMKAAGFNARRDSWFGTHKVADNQLSLYDNRMVFGLGFGATGSSTQNTLGGDRVRNNTDLSTSAIRMTPTEAWRTVDIYDLALSGGPASAVQPSIGGTADGNGVVSGDTNLGGVLSQSNATTIYRLTTRDTGVAAAVQAFNFKRIAASTATVYLCGMDFYDPAALDIAIYNFGQAGTSSEFLSYSALSYNPMAAIQVVAPHGVFVDALTNDVLNSGLAYSTIEANLVSVINSCKAAAPGVADGSVILMDSVGVNVAGATAQRQRDVRDLVITVAMANGCAFIDNQNALGGDWATAQARGLMGDNNHPNAAGAVVLAAAPAALMMAA